MGNQVLSIEQMQELKDLGIDISNASMCWFGCADGNDIYPYNKTFRKCFEEHLDTIPLVLTPTFTLQDILNILPGSIEEDIKGRFDYELRIKKDGVAYESFDALDSNSEPYVFDEYYIDDEQYKTVLDCAFEMLKSLKTLKKI